MNTEYEAVIGLEVHCQLGTSSKAFSPDSAAFGGDPNTHVDPVSLGHPGTLPVFNRKAIEYTVRMGLATHCKIAPRSVFARKHYFYPDLPKGYQISQFDEPICSDGYVVLPFDRASGNDSEGNNVSGERRIEITRIHMEEDAGKSIHDQSAESSLLDFNRCGVPLMEIVTEPVLRSAREAYLYLRTMRQLVRYTGISDGNMEEGSLRCDANVSIRVRGSRDLGTKTEIKNLNSFRNVERAIEAEIARQIRLRSEGKEIVSETRLWDDQEERTRSMRSKEEAHDYRYFPDPDLPPVIVTDDLLNRVVASMPVLPEDRMVGYTVDWQLPVRDAIVLTEERDLADYFEATVVGTLGLTPAESPPRVAKAVANIMMSQVLRVLKEQGTTVSELSITPSRLSELVALRIRQDVSSTGARSLFDLMLTDDAGAETLAERHNYLQVSNEDDLIPVIERVISDYPGPVSQYRAGKSGVMGFLIGQVMRTFPGAADPTRVRTILEEKLHSQS
jgi:aspartyl-tRNA(Asn)/glutamyl-tRNA(Gln) amidotransferase subunit B